MCTWSELKHGGKSHPDGWAQLQLLEEACCMSYLEKSDCYKLKSNESQEQEKPARCTFTLVFHFTMCCRVGHELGILAEILVLRA